MQDKFYEATQSSLVESNKYFLDLPGIFIVYELTEGFTSLLGFSERHASIVSEMLSRIADLIKHISDLYFVSLPVKMRKNEGYYAFSFYNDLTKYP
jgi:hypothetical protein